LSPGPVGANRRTVKARLKKGPPTQRSIPED
jgi:hypothetical protein